VLGGWVSGVVAAFAFQAVFLAVLLPRRVVSARVDDRHPDA
jgi:hypothetical protein